MPGEVCATLTQRLAEAITLSLLLLLKALKKEGGTHHWPEYPGPESNYEAAPCWSLSDSRSNLVDCHATIAERLGNLLIPTVILPCSAMGGLQVFLDQQTGPWGLICLPQTGLIPKHRLLPPAPSAAWLAKGQQGPRAPSSLPGCLLMTTGQEGMGGRRGGSG